ncbi:MAG: GtrA family protein [Actinomycetota bacterium]|jgi:putative flippase GtrA|nr:GtrA family protein [Actinomycetota bacterium]
MTFSPRYWWEWLWTPTGKTAIRYSITSVISTGVTLIVLSITYGVFKLWSAVVCSVVANMVATVPSYYLNRSWAWGKTGRSHLLKEVLPFWSLTVVGIVLSLVSVFLADRYSYLVTSSHFGKSILVDAANLAAFGVVWVGKFMTYNRFLFGQHTTNVASADEELAAGDQELVTQAATLAAGSVAIEPESGEREFALVPVVAPVGDDICEARQGSNTLVDAGSGAA